MTQRSACHDYLTIVTTVQFFRQFADVVRSLPNEFVGERGITI